MGGKYLEICPNIRPHKPFENIFSPTYFRIVWFEAIWHLESPILKFDCKFVRMASYDKLKVISFINVKNKSQHDMELESWRKKKMCPATCFLHSLDSWVVCYILINKERDFILFLSKWYSSFQVNAIFHECL